MLSHLMLSDGRLHQTQREVQCSRHRVGGLGSTPLAPHSSGKSSGALNKTMPVVNWVAFDYKSFSRSAWGISIVRNKLVWLQLTV